jgi:hypothetical protein
MSAVSTSLDRPTNRARRAGAAFGEACRVAISEHRLYLAIILGFALLCVGAGWIAGASAVVSIRFYAAPFVLLIGVFAGTFVLGHAVWTAAVMRPEGSLFGAIGRDLKTRILIPRRIAGFLAAGALAPLFFSTFGSFKRMIPILNPFGWDQTFMEWDRWLHLGEHPWRLLQPLLGTPLITSAISFAYNLWFFVLIFTFIWQAMSLKRPALRMQFLIAFLLSWILLGTVLATLLSSGGPVYYGRVSGLADPFASLMAYLQATNAQFPVWSLEVQDMLWASHARGGIDFGSGISAMPSLHVAMAVLLAIVGWKTHRILGIAYTAFAVIIQIGAVHLGWHYAIDGYVSALALVPIWWLAGLLARRAVPAPDPVAADPQLPKRALP